MRSIADYKEANRPVGHRREPPRPEEVFRESLKKLSVSKSILTVDGDAQHRQGKVGLARLQFGNGEVLELDDPQPTRSSKSPSNSLSVPMILLMEEPVLVHPTMSRTSGLSSTAFARRHRGNDDSDADDSGSDGQHTETGEEVLAARMALPSREPSRLGMLLSNSSFSSTSTSPSRPLLRQPSQLSRRSQDHEQPHHDAPQPHQPANTTSTTTTNNQHRQPASPQSQAHALSAPQQLLDSPFLSSSPTTPQDSRRGDSDGGDGGGDAAAAAATNSADGGYCFETTTADGSTSTGDGAGITSPTGRVDQLLRQLRRQNPKADAALFIGGAGVGGLRRPSHGSSDASLLVRLRRTSAAAVATPQMLDLEVLLQHQQQLQMQQQYQQYQRLQQQQQQQPGGPAAAGPGASTVSSSSSKLLRISEELSLLSLSSTPSSRPALTRALTSSLEGALHTQPGSGGGGGLSVMKGMGRSKSQASMDSPPRLSRSSTLGARSSRGGAAEARQSNAGSLHAPSNSVLAAAVHTLMEAEQEGNAPGAAGGNSGVLMSPRGSLELPSGASYNGAGVEGGNGGTGGGGGGGGLRLAATAGAGGRGGASGSTSLSGSVGGGALGTVAKVGKVTAATEAPVLRLPLLCPVAGGNGGKGGDRSSPGGGGNGAVNAGGGGIGRVLRFHGSHLVTAA